MKPITSYVDLLQKHAREGDPAAFYSLFSAQCKELYIHIRSKGMAHKQALLTILPFLRTLYRTYVRRRPKEEPAEWFNHRKKALPESRAPSDTDEFFVENIDAEGVKDFERSTQLMLQREYGRLRDAYGESFLRGRRLRKRMLRLCIIAIVIAGGVTGLFTGLDYVLKSTDSRIDIAVTLPEYIISFSLPPVRKNGPLNTATSSEKSADSIGVRRQDADTERGNVSAVTEKPQPASVVAPPSRPPATALPMPVSNTIHAAVKPLAAQSGAQISSPPASPRTFSTGSSSFSAKDTSAARDTAAPVLPPLSPAITPSTGMKKNEDTSGQSGN